MNTQAQLHRTAVRTDVYRADILARSFGLAAGLLILLCVSAGTVHAQEWTYTVRPGDNLWDFTEEYLTHIRYWKRLQEINDIQRPRNMIPGSKIRVPIAWLKVQPEPARVMQVSGTAELIRAGSERSETLTVDHELHSGDRIRTAADSNVTLHFADDSELLIQSDSDIIMDTLSSYHKTGMVDTRVRLQQGRVDTRVKPSQGPGSRYHIITPAAVAAVRGTNFRVSTESGQPVSRSEVIEGKVNVSSDIDAQLVPAGYGVVTEKGRPTPPPRELLPAPDGSGMPEVFQRLPLAFAWNAVDGAHGYRFQVAEHAEFSTLIADRQTSTPSGLWHDLPDGDYFLRLRAVDDEQLEGRNGDYAFSVDARPFPPFLVEPRDNITLRDARPTFSWSEPENVSKYRVQLAADPEFATLLHDDTHSGAAHFKPAQALAVGRYHWRTASIDASGEQGPYSDAHQFEYRAVPPSPDFKEPEVGKDELVIQWQSAGEGVSYRFQMAEDPEFEQLAMDKVIEEPRVVMPRPIPETYYFRARTIDSDGYEGEFGPAQKLTVQPTSFWSLLIPVILLF